MTTFTIDIISDPVCLWCYIGQKRLHRAIDLYRKTYPGGSTDIFLITWRPYYLKPDCATNSGIVNDVMIRRMGEEKAASVQSQISAIAMQEGINVRYGGRSGSTRLAHRLLHFAKTAEGGGLDVQNEVAAELFRLHFEEEKDITSVETMLDVARACGMDINAAKAYLESGAGIAEVDVEAAAMRKLTGTGVPRYRFQGGEYEIDGAKDSMEFYEIFMKIKGDPSAADM